MSMDEITASLAGSFQVSHHPNNPAAPHPRFQDLYKSKGSGVDQHERRRRAISFQKKGRFDQLALIRQLADNDWSGRGGRRDAEEDMETAPPACRRPGTRYKNQLMLSEWLLEKPDNFEKDWVMVPCPVGKRNLVIASRGMTYSYSKNGYLMKEFYSGLPGGNRSWQGRDEVTILDCVFVENMKTFFVLDLMCWKSHPIYDTETEFRLFWLKSQLDELDGITQTKKSNQFKFVALPNFACEKDNLTGVMTTATNIELDGLLFYHKETHYTFGPTPLVLWLKAYMMPEILGVNIAKFHFALQPANYKNFSTHVEEVRKQQQQQKTQQDKGKKKTHQAGYGADLPKATPGLQNPECYPQELQREGYQRTGLFDDWANLVSTMASAKKGKPHVSHLDRPKKAHVPHGMRDQQQDTPPTESAMQSDAPGTSTTSESAFVFSSQDVRTKDATHDETSTETPLEEPNEDAGTFSTSDVLVEEETIQESPEQLDNVEKLNVGVWDPASDATEVAEATTSESSHPVGESNQAEPGPWEEKMEVAKSSGKKRNRKKKNKGRNYSKMDL